MWSWIEKTLQCWDRIPVPRIVTKAVEVLETASEEIRLETGSRKLFQYKQFAGEPVFNLGFQKGLNEFAIHVKVPPLEDGSDWLFKPHQFRRFFSLLYMYRYQYGQHGKFEAFHGISATLIWR